MINFLIAVALVLFIAILFIYIFRALTAPAPMYTQHDDDVEVTTTTTTTTVTEDVATRTVNDLPPLERHFKSNGQPFCIDPVDGDEWMLNTNDDMYEDAKGNWYRLVDPALKV